MLTAKAVARSLIAFSLLSFSLAGNGQTRCPQDKRAGDVASRFMVGGGSVVMPIGAFLLIRRNGQLGAIRVISIDPPDTQGFGKTTYESFFQGDGSGSLLAKNVVPRTGELDLQPLKGPGRGIYTYRPGMDKARVGKWAFHFNTATVMEMSDLSFWTGFGDHGFEFAPTAACSLSEVDVHDPRLKWFRFDRNASITLPLSELPK